MADDRLETARPAFSAATKPSSTAGPENVRRNLDS
jgi:hypothetical protein